MILKSLSKEKVIFFDFECELCHRFVCFIFKRDAKKQFLYAPLQGEHAKKYLFQKASCFNSIVFLDRGLKYQRSEAIARILFFIYPFLKYFSFLPFSFYNLFYDKVAKKRYSWFGKKKQKDKLKIPQQYFLD